MRPGDRERRTAALALHLGKYYEHLDDGIDLTGSEYYELGQLDHWERCGFGHHVIQATRRLAEGPSGHHYHHRFGIRYVSDLFMHLMLGPGYVGKDVGYPYGFVHIKVYKKPYYDAANLPYFPKEGGGNVAHKENHDTQGELYMYLCPICESAAPAYLGSDKCVCQILRSNI